MLSANLFALAATLTGSAATSWAQTIPDSSLEASPETRGICINNVLSDLALGLPVVLWHRFRRPCCTCRFRLLGLVTSSHTSESLARARKLLAPLQLCIPKVSPHVHRGAVLSLSQPEEPSSRFLIESTPVFNLYHGSGVIVQASAWGNGQLRTFPSDGVRTPDLLHSRKHGDTRGTGRDRDREMHRLRVCVCVRACVGQVVKTSYWHKPLWYWYPCQPIAFH